MSSYEKLKNDELKKLLTERNLPTTGKKADFVARLTEHDTKQPTTTASSGAAEASPQVSTPKTAAATVPTPAAAGPTQTTQSAAPTTKAETPSASDTQDHAAREALLAKRAARFGIPKDEEEERKKARAARFGTAQTTQTTLPEDKALSQPKMKGQASDKRKESKTPAAAKPATQQQQPEKRKVSVLDDPIEAEKARKRALKFGTAAVSSPATQDPAKPPAVEIAST